MTDYEGKAPAFLRKHGAKMTISHKFKDSGEWETSEMTGGYLYRVRIDRNHKSWSFDFSDCKANYETSNRPSRYDVLACIEKYEPEPDIWFFATIYGYEIRNKESYDKVNQIHKAVQKEYRNVKRMFGDCLEELREIW